MASLKVWLRRLFGSEKPGLALSLPNQRTEPGKPDSFAADNNNFALTLYGLLDRRPGNLFFSPFSIRTALAMTYAGARGETAAQIRAALHLSSSNKMHFEFTDIIQRLNAAGDGKYEMAVANSLWGQDGATLQPEFRDIVTSRYAGEIRLIDFRRAAEAAHVTINRWVEDKTRSKIQDLIPSGSLTPLTRLVLVNAVYFKGKWTLQFRKAATHDESFYLEGGGKVQAPLMRRQEEIRYLQASGYQAVDLEYQGGDLSMLVLLPDRKDGLRDLETQLSERMLQDCVADMRINEVKLFLPRFKITWGAVDLRDSLTALGMTRAFEQYQADFSGINGCKPPHEEALFISAAFHKAFADVNEEGTEAAAATAVAVMAMAMRPPEPPPVPIFRADHPFVFGIRDQKSGAILFLGRIVDPTRGS